MWIITITFGISCARVENGFKTEENLSMHTEVRLKQPDYSEQIEAQNK